MKVLAQVKLPSTKFASTGTNWRQIHLTLSFGPKLSLAPCSTPLYFFHTQFWVSSHILAKLGVVIPSFNNFTITLLSSKQNVILLGYVLVGLKVFPMANIVTWLVNQILNEVNVTMV